MAAFGFSSIRPHDRGREPGGPAAGLADLDPEEVRLLTWYYFEEQTKSQIGRRLGVSQMQVSRLLARAVQRLRPSVSSNL